MSGPISADSSASRLRYLGSPCMSLIIKTSLGAFLRVLADSLTHRSESDWPEGLSNTFNKLGLPHSTGPELFKKNPTEKHESCSLGSSK